MKTRLLIILVIVAAISLSLLASDQYYLSLQDKELKESGWVQNCIPVESDRMVPSIGLFNHTHSFDLRTCSWNPTEHGTPGLLESLYVSFVEPVFLDITDSLEIKYAYASCAAPPPIGAEFYNFEKAHVVFVGTVTDIYNPHPDIHTGTEEYDTITFDVLRVLKGDVGDGTVRTGHDSVGYHKFEIGKSYLVFAFGGIRDVGQCTPPILLSDESAPTFLEWQYYVPFVMAAGVIVMIIALIILRKVK